jgi:hypothetical protein
VSERARDSALDSDPTARGAGRSFAYDVAISYAAADFTFAESLAALLERRGLRVFFDRHQSAALCGAELCARLDNVFEEESRAIVIVGSRAYGMSEWTSRELAAAKRRITDAHDAGCVLPVSVDGAWIPGLERLAHIRLRPPNQPALNEDELAELLFAKLRPPLAAPVSRPESSAPMTQWHPSPQKNERLSVQPNVSLNATGGSGGVVSRVDSRTRVDNRKGLGAVGIVFILVVVTSAVGVMAWMAFDFVRNAPRNADGTVTILGIPLPPSITSAIQPTEPPEEAITRSAANENERAERPEPETSTTQDTPAGAPTTQALQGLWVCSNGARVTFTETRRVAITRSGPQGEQIFEDSPFVTWKAAPYAFVAARTIRVGDSEADLELTEDGRQIRLIGGMVHMDCHKQRF